MLKLSCLKETSGSVNLAGWTDFPVYKNVSLTYIYFVSPSWCVLTILVIIGKG